MSIEFAGLTALAVDLERLPAALDVSEHPTAFFKRFYPEVLWPHAIAEVRDALSSGDKISETASCALLDVLGAVGKEVGSVKAPIEVSAEFPRFATRWYPWLFGDDARADRALRGGVLGLVGSGRFAFGSLTAEEWQACASGPRALSADEQEELDRGGRWFAEWARQLVRVLARSDGKRALVLVPHYVELVHDEQTYEGATRPPERREERPPSPPNLLELLKRGMAEHATDVVAMVGAPLCWRIGPRLEPVDPSPLTRERVIGLMRPVLTDAQLDRYERGGLVFAFGIKDLGRFRVMMALQRGSPLVSIRLLPFDPPPLESLGLPASLANLEPGLVLVGGDAGSGRTTAVASIVRAILENHRAFVLTIEEPIEYFHPPRLGLTAQMEIDGDVPSFEKALSFARASGADVVVLDHVDSAERLAAARELAAAGKKVLATVSGRPEIGATIVFPKRAG
ncbi:MAG: hypothetical protein ACOX6T_08720 [Myxococcales bacterium]|jgi:hypothetical protein